jgi:hypothetical protein
MRLHVLESACRGVIVDKAQGPAHDDWVAYAVGANHLARAWLPVFL